MAPIRWDSDSNSDSGSTEADQSTGQSDSDTKGNTSPSNGRGYKNSGAADGADSAASGYAVQNGAGPVSFPLSRPIALIATFVGALVAF